MTCSLVIVYTVLLLAFMITPRALNSSLALILDLPGLLVVLGGTMTVRKDGRGTDV
jgi:hypothetical protein